jgi:hypothetical protein
MVVHLLGIKRPLWEPREWDLRSNKEGIRMW